MEAIQRTDTYTYTIDYYSAIKKNRKSWDLQHELTLNESISVSQSFRTLCDPMDCSTPGLPVHHQLHEFNPNSCPLSRWCHPTISSSNVPFSSCPQSFPESGSFPTSQLFSLGGYRIGASASASVLPVTCKLLLLYPLSKGFSRQEY